MQRDPDPGSYLVLFGVLVLLGFFGLFAVLGALPDWGRLVPRSISLESGTERFWLMVAAGVAAGAVVVWLLVALMTRR